MLSRPAAAALSCRGCQSALFRAVLSTHSPSVAQRAALKALVPRNQELLYHRRFHSVDHSSPASETTKQAQATGDLKSETQVEEVDTEELDSESGTPWFLEVEAPRHPASQHAVTLPNPPEGAPELLQPLIKYVYDDMGLDEITLLDLRDIDPPAALGPNLIMLLATARSERHLHVSASRFVKWLRRNYQISANAGGLIGPGELKTKLRRLRKKAKLLGTNTAIVPGGDNGISTGWVCVNFTAPGGEANETERLDEDGKFSGFGSALSGTTVVVQCLTESRRHELDLETLWQGILKRSLRAAEEVKGQGRPDDAKIQEMVSSRLQLSGSPAQLQWQALSQASQRQFQQQKRSFSTSLRKMKSRTPENSDKDNLLWETVEAEPAREAVTEEVAATQEVAPPEPPPTTLADLQESISNLQVMGQPIPNETVLRQLISSILMMPLAEEGTAKARLALLDQITLTAHERGMKILSTGVLVAIINGLVRSPARGEETQRAQDNVEMLLRQNQTTLEEQDAMLLMEAHSSQGDWTRFYDIFNWNTRFGERRHFALYAVAFRCLVSGGDPRVCMDGLRTIWPEFLREAPSPQEVANTLPAARDCILLARPDAEELYVNPPDPKVFKGKDHLWWNHHEGRRLMEGVITLARRIRSGAWEDGAIIASMTIPVPTRNRTLEPTLEPHEEEPNGEEATKE